MNSSILWRNLLLLMELRMQMPTPHVHLSLLQNLVYPFLSIQLNETLPGQDTI